MCTKNASPLGHLVGLMLLGLPATGCSSGIARQVTVTDNAVVVVDRVYPTITIIDENHVDHLTGRSVAPMARTGRWLVFLNLKIRARWTKLDAGDPETIRLLVPEGDVDLRAYHLERKTMNRIKHPFDANNERLVDFCVHNEKLAMEVAGRYVNDAQGRNPRYYAMQLPAGEWKRIDQERWKSIKRTATSTINTSRFPKENL